jgi:hypothetical protein
MSGLTCCKLRLFVANKEPILSDTGTITLEKLRVLTEAGAVQYAEAVGVPGGWVVHVKVGMTNRVMKPARGTTPRVFKSVDALLGVLRRDAGIRRVSIDQAGYSPVGI